MSESVVSSSKSVPNDDIPALLLSQCWALLAAERQKIAARPPVKFEIDVFTPIFLRDLYVRADSDRDGRIEMEEMHNLLATYLSDLVGEDLELPRGFSMAVTRAVISTNDYVSWSEFRICEFLIDPRNMETLFVLHSRLTSRMTLLQQLLAAIVAEYRTELKKSIGRRL